MRRAVIIVNIILLVGRLLALLGLVTAKSLFAMDSADQSITGYDLAADVTPEPSTVTEGRVVFELAKSVVGVWCAGLSIYGAITYNKYLVAANAIFLVLVSPSAGFIGMIIGGLYVYPHAFLIYYLHNGIISKMNYANERQSCCCV